MEVMLWMKPGMTALIKGKISVCTAYINPKAPFVGFIIALGLADTPVM